MKQCTILFVLLVWLSLLVPTAMPDCPKSNNQCSKSPTCEKNVSKCESKKIEEILLKMHNATKELNSCQAKIKYLVIQDPDLLNSKTLQNGTLYYLKADNRSYLRIRFDDKKEDDFELEKQREEYLFDGVWLTRINYKLKQVDRYQQAPEDKPIDVFELISGTFPLIGFSNINQLKKDFDVQFSEKPDKSDCSIRLLLNVKKGSKYEKDYKKIDFWVSKNTYMPEKIVAYSSQGDIYDIQFQEFKINKKLKKAIFTVETPPDFRKNIEPLEEKTTKKGN